MRNWNLHKQLHPWIKQLMTQLWAEHMVLCAWDRQMSWQQMGQWFQTKLWIPSANLDPLHKPLPPSLMLTTHVQPQHKKTAWETLCWMKLFSWGGLKDSHPWAGENQTLRCHGNSALVWDVSPGVPWGCWGQPRQGPERLLSISKSLRQGSFPL